jgi:3'(2'), 5'-bisphosphate nucleotidase
MSLHKVRHIELPIFAGHATSKIFNCNETFRATSMSKQTNSPKNRSYKLLVLVSIIVLAFSAFLVRFPLPRLSTTKPFAASSVFAPARKMSTSYAHEYQIALLAVQRASILTREVYNTTAKGTVSKSDHSPVTIGDFGAQALIISALKHNFPNDEIVAEEESDDLIKDEVLRSKVWGYVSKTKLEDEVAEKELGGAVPSVEKMLEIIDSGKSEGGRKGRIWTLDPIDGTKGFLRGGQYAIALALLEDGDIKVGVLGCPNLPVDDSVRLDANIGHDQDGQGNGVLVSARLGAGAWSQPLSQGDLGERKKIHMREVKDISEATFCESVEALHSDHSTQGKIARELGVTKDSVRMDSQAKYASISRGAGDIYLRLKTKKDYYEKIWDHAAGDLVVREAGGVVTDVKGDRLDFGAGRTLGPTQEGIVAAPASIHATVLKVVQSVLASKL